MPRKSINFELDFMKKDIFPRFTVKQFDDVSFNIKPKNQGLDYDTTGMTGKIFVGVNNDMFMQTTGITVSSNNINVLLDKNMLQNRGRAYAEIELTDSNGTITSSSFIFNIDAKIGEGAKIPGEYEGFVAKYERLISEFKAQVNSTIDNCNTNINSTINNCNKAVDNKLNDVDNFVDNKILDIEKRFNALASSQQQEAEVIDARDGEVSLKARLDRDLAKWEIIDLSDYYTKSETYNKTEIDSKIANMGAGGSVDLSNYYTKSETDEAMNDKANKVHTHNEYLTELPTHTHSEYLKELPSHEHEQYLTEHQDISHKANKSDTYTKTETDNKISEEIAKAQLGGSGEVDLSSYATKNYVNEEIAKIELKEGPQGPKGDTGETGPQGPQGETPSIAHLEAIISNKISEVDELIHQLTNNRIVDGGEL